MGFIGRGGTPSSGMNTNDYNYFIEMLFITLITFVIRSYRSLCRAEGDTTYAENTDWFYDKK